MENSLLETLRKQQEEAQSLLDGLKEKKDAAKKNYDHTKSEYDQQKIIVDQNARALRAFEPRKPRQKKSS